MITKQEFEQAVAAIEQEFGAGIAKEPERLANIAFEDMSRVASMQTTLEMLMTSQLVYLTQLFPGKLEVEEYVDADKHNGDQILRVKKGGLVLGSVTRYMHDTDVSGDSFQTETSFSLTRLGTALLDQFIPERAQTAKGVIAQALKVSNIEGGQQ